MNILVISDSHHNHFPVKKLLTLYEKQIGFAVHLGDHDEDLLRYKRDFPHIEMQAVEGNCDGHCFADSHIILRINGKKILLIHGHLQNVKMGLTRLGFYAQEKEVDACLFGHTHKPVMFDDGPIFFMNPGSIGRPVYGEKPGYGLLRISDEGVIHGTLMNFP